MIPPRFRTADARARQAIGKAREFTRRRAGGLTDNLARQKNARSCPRSVKVRIRAKAAFDFGYSDAGLTHRKPFDPIGFCPLTINSTYVE